MRDHVSTEISHVTRVLKRPTSFNFEIIKRREVAFALAAAFLVATASGALVVRGLTMASTGQQNDSITTDQQTTASSVSAVTTDTQPVSEGDQSTMDGTNADNSSSDSQSKTTVTVNNQQVPVPENGSVTKTVVSGNGTTTVNVTSNTDTSGSSNSNSSTNLNVSTHTSSRTESSSSE